MLCFDDSAEMDSISSSDTNAWVDFEPEEVSIKEVKVEPKSSACKVHPEPKMEDVQKALVPLTKVNSHAPQKELTIDNHTTPEKLLQDSIPSSVLQRLSTLTQDGAALAVATGTSNGWGQPYPSIKHHSVVNGLQQPSRNGGSVELTMKTRMSKTNQGNFSPSTVPYTMARASMAMVGRNSLSGTPARRAPTAATLPVSGHDYDFSFLTRGMLSKP